jgi:hypothetical protein
MKKFRVGVLTFHNGPNYGGFMQAWHMVHAVRSLGPDCHAVNYLHPSHVESNKVKVPINGIKALRARAYWFLRRLPFRGLGDTLCAEPFTNNPDLVRWAEFDRLLVGSDIVWDYQDHKFGHDPVYFGSHPKQAGIPISSYAASCGPVDIGKEIPDYVCTGLKRFSSIGVRDSTTKAMVSKACNRESEIVVDPTWLGDDPVIEWKGAPKEPYVLLYGGGVDESRAQTIIQYCQLRGLKIVSAATPYKFSHKVYRMLTPFQWVHLFRNAAATVVGTMHGALYSIKYEKPFVVISNPRIASKLENILLRTNQTFRLFKPQGGAPFDANLLDWNPEVNPTISMDWKNESLQFLRTAIGLE